MMMKSKFIFVLLIACSTNLLAQLECNKHNIDTMTQFDLPIYSIDNQKLMQVFDTVIEFERQQEYYNDSLIFFVEVSMNSLWSEKINDTVYDVLLWTSVDNMDIKDAKGCFYYKDLLFVVKNAKILLSETSNKKHFRLKTRENETPMTSNKSTRIVIIDDTHPTYFFLYYDNTFHDINKTNYYRRKTETGETVQIYFEPEQMPCFPGGMDSLRKYLGENIVYPQNAIDNNLKGTCFIRLTVMSDGNVTDVCCSRNEFSAECCAEAVRVVKLMPKWNPGLQGGIPVNAEVTLPIKFKLLNGHGIVTILHLATVL